MSSSTWAGGRGRCRFTHERLPPSAAEQSTSTAATRRRLAVREAAGHHARHLELAADDADVATRCAAGAHDRGELVVDRRQEAWRPRRARARRPRRRPCPSGRARPSGDSIDPPAAAARARRRTPWSRCRSRPRRPTLRASGQTGRRGPLPQPGVDRRPAPPRSPPARPCRRRRRAPDRASRRSSPTDPRATSPTTCRSTTGRRASVPGPAEPEDVRFEQDWDDRGRRRHRRR